MLTPLTPAQQAHTDNACAHIRSLIAESGPIPFSQFMHEALYAPGVGYYVSGNHKLGAAGDFTTAPLISPLFAQCLANQCAEILAQQPAGDIFELGAGTGDMALGIINALAQQNQLPTRYLILEPSAELRARQQQHLQQQLPAELSRLVQWIDDWPAADSFTGVILANEVLDAMPVERVLWQDNAWWQVTVSYATKENNFCWTTTAVTDERLQQALAAIPTPTQSGYCTEINLWAPPWINSLATCLHQGLALIIDYGFLRDTYYHPQRNQGTLKCHFQHQANDDPLQNIGLQDITAHVDFTVVGDTALTAGLEVMGFCNQAEFLINCGLTNELSKVTNREQYTQLLPGIKQLTLPQEMGELFKVIGIGRGLQNTPLGFSDFR